MNFYILCIRYIGKSSAAATSSITAGKHNFTKQGPITACEGWAKHHLQALCHICNYTNVQMDVKTAQELSLLTARGTGVRTHPSFKEVTLVSMPSYSRCS